jgi:hypothetical protein
MSSIAAEVQDKLKIRNITATIGSALAMTADAMAILSAGNMVSALCNYDAHRLSTEARFRLRIQSLDTIEEQRKDHRSLPSHSLFVSRPGSSTAIWDQWIAMSKPALMPIDCW